MSSGKSSTRERILAETRRLMVERRGQGVRLGDIARAAGISRQALYLHFASRTELLVATARHLDEVLGGEERMRPFFAADTGSDALDAYITFWGNYIPQIYGLAKALLAARDTDEAAAAAWRDRMVLMWDGCCRVATMLERDGTLAPPWSVGDATDMLYALLSSIAVWENLTLDRGRTTEDYLHWMRTTLRQTFVRGGER